MCLYDFGMQMFDDFYRYFYDVAVAKCRLGGCTVRYCWRRIRHVAASPNDSAPHATDAVRLEVFRGTDLEFEFFDTSGCCGAVFFVLCRWSDITGRWHYVARRCVTVACHAIDYCIGMVSLQRLMCGVVWLAML